MSIRLQNGVALIEVLVTSVIIAIGLTGTAALMLKSIQSTNDTAQRSIGLWVVQDYMGRIRANREGAHDFGYVIGEDATDCETLPSNICSDIFKEGNKINASQCTPKQMALFDNWITVCGINSDAIDNASEMVKDPKLLATCISDTTPDRNNDGDPGCLKYEITFKWKSQVKQSDGNVMTQEMEYGQIVEIN